MIHRSIPLIGITADLANRQQSTVPTKGEATAFLPQRYIDAVDRAGGLPVILPPIGSDLAVRKIIDSLDGLVISGGDFDIHPRYYGEKPGNSLGNIIPARTEFELALAALALRRDMPVLGICGGAQAINVALGGSLIQDIKTEIDSAVEHQQSAGKHSGGHRVQVALGSLLHRIVERRAIEVNTTHHQAIKNPGKGLIVNATAPDGVIEGIESKRHTFVLGVQWHPEVLAPRRLPHRQLFTSFLDRCRLHRRAR